jgi:hypothetical protein
MTTQQPEMSPEPPALADPTVGNPISPALWPARAQTSADKRGRMTGQKLAVILLAVGLGLAVLGGAGGMLVVGAAAVQQSDRADHLQRQVDKQKAATEAEAAAVAAMKARFDSEKFADKYQKVKEASAKQVQALKAYTATQPGTKPEEAAFNAWQDTIYACLSAASDYNLAAKGYPAEWFTSAAPPVVDLVRTDTACYGGRS